MTLKTPNASPLGIVGYQDRLTDTISTKLERILRSNILSGAPGYEPGDRINIEQLIADLGVSSTPIKDALRQLISDGLVISVPRRGFFVVQASERDLDELVITAEGLERWALKLLEGRFDEKVLREMELAIDKADDYAKAGALQEYIREDLKFHHLIVSSPDNKRLESIYDQTMAQVLIRYLYHPRLGEASHTSIYQHRELVLIFANGDLDASDQALAMHWEESRGRMMASYRAYEGSRRTPATATEK